VSGDPSARGSNGAVDELDARDADGAGGTVVLDVLRVEVVEALDPTEEERAIGQLAIRVAVELVALQSIARIEVAEGAGAWIETGDAAVGAHPEVAGFIW
jgi:hypothetical protein